MPLPVSKSQIRKLGQRLLAKSVSSDDELLLQDLLYGFDEVKTAVRSAIVAMELPSRYELGVTARTKTRDTLIEKISRLNGSGRALASVQDIAGVRVVAKATLDEQDEIARAIAAESFWDVEPTLVDRRSVPVQGYRAVHLVGSTAGGWNVEIQVRTTVQDAWANMYEALGDAFGRGIRYPDYDDISVVSPDVRALVSMCMSLSLDKIVLLEDAENVAAAIRASLRSAISRKLNVKAQLSSESGFLDSGLSVRGLIRDKLHPMDREVRVKKRSMIDACNDLADDLTLSSLSQ